jgi:hypothetical protein
MPERGPHLDAAQAAARTRAAANIRLALLLGAVALLLYVAFLVKLA